jgi:hypothetical protein
MRRMPDEYNDGASNRASGYSMSANFLSYESSDALDSLPSREQVQAARVLVGEAKTLGLDLAALVNGMLSSFVEQAA